MRIIAIIQARLGSTRLPGKVLLDLAGEPMLARVVNRVHRATKVHDIVVATTTKAEDAALIEMCTLRHWRSFRGSEDDVLDRYYQAAVQHRADVVIRITSDCPLVDPEIVDRVVQEFLDLQPEVDYACNVLPQRTFPRGLDTEVMRFDVLERAWREDLNLAWREHVTSYISRNSELFQIHGILNERDYSHMRWTVDTPEDLAFVRRIYDYFGHDRFSWREVLSVLEQNLQWLELNRSVKQKAVPGYETRET